MIKSTAKVVLFFDINKFLTTNVNYAKPQPKLDMEAIKAGKFTLG